MNQLIIAGLTISSMLVGAIIGNWLSTMTYMEVIAKQAELADVRLQICEAQADNRLIAVLGQVDMECFGRWSTADGEITLYPTDKKEESK